MRPFHYARKVPLRIRGSIVRGDRWLEHILAMLLGVLGLFVEVGHCVVAVDVVVAAVVEPTRRQRHEMIACHLAEGRCYSAGS